MRKIKTNRDLITKGRQTAANKHNITDRQTDRQTDRRREELQDHQQSETTHVVQRPKSSRHVSP